LSSLSELERLKMDNNTLRVMYLQLQTQQVQAERAAIINEIEAAHPGWEWNDQQGLIPLSKVNLAPTHEELYPEMTPH
jgi:hypothetical protein